MAVNEPKEYRCHVVPMIHIFNGKIQLKCSYFVSKRSEVDYLFQLFPGRDWKEVDQLQQYANETLP